MQISLKNKFQIRSSLQNRKKQKGLSLIEASMVLVLSGIVVAGVMAYYQNAVSNNRLQETLKTTMNVISTVNGLYANNSHYDGLNTKMVANVLDLTVNAADALPLPFNQAELNIAAANLDATEYKPDPGDGKRTNIKNYMIELKEIPMSLCTKLYSASFGSSFVGFQAAFEGGSLGLVEGSAPLADRLGVCKKLADTVISTGPIGNGPDTKIKVDLVFK